MKTLSKPIVVPVALFALGSLTVLSGAFRLTSIGAGPDAKGADEMAHYFAHTPLITAHIVAGILFNLMTPLQFVAGLRQRLPAVHRWSGRLLVVAGVIAGATAVWMNEIFPDYGGFAKYLGLHLFGSGLILTLVLGLRAAFVRDFDSHRAWMMRAMALGLGGATQRIYLLPIFVYFGELSDAAIAAGIWSGFLINLIFVEWLLWRERMMRKMAVPDPS